jgi:molybdopterin-binding protein
VSGLSRQAADELGLEVGVTAVAVIKSTNVVGKIIDHTHLVSS